MITRTVTFDSKQEPPRLAWVLNCEVNEEPDNPNLGNNGEALFLKHGPQQTSQSRSMAVRRFRFSCERSTYQYHLMRLIRS